MQDQDWLRQLKKSLKSFFRGCPVKIQPVYTKNLVRLNFINLDYFCEFYYEDIPVKDFIHNIWKVISKYYPRITLSFKLPKLVTVNAKDYDSIAKYLEDTESYKVVTFETTFIINKFCPKNNVIILMDEKTSEKHKIRSKLPLILFYEKVLNMEVTNSDIYEYITEKCFLKDLIPKD